MDLAPLLKEAFLTGAWKNFEEMEESINLTELNAICAQVQKQEHRQYRFFAQLIKQIDLGDPEESEEEGKTEKVEVSDVEQRALRRINAERGMSPEQLEELYGSNSELASLGLHEEGAV